MSILLNPKCRHMWVGLHREVGRGETAKAKSPSVRGRCAMRHIIVATTMLTFAAASVLQGVAVANVQSNNEPYVVVEAAKAPMKAVGTKERLTSHYRERGVQTAAQFGL